MPLQLDFCTYSRIFSADKSTWDVEAKDKQCEMAATPSVLVFQRNKTIWCCIYVQLTDPWQHGFETHTSAYMWAFFSPINASALFISRFHIHNSKQMENMGLVWYNTSIHGVLTFHVLEFHRAHCRTCRPWVCTNVGILPADTKGQLYKYMHRYVCIYTYIWTRIHTFNTIK